MLDTYSKIFSGYVHDMKWRMKKSEEETFSQLVEIIPMSEENRIDLADHLSRLRSSCCEESFALGIQLGLRIAGEFSVK